MCVCKRENCVCYARYSVCVIDRDGVCDCELDSFLCF